ncbi:MAG: flagellar biosynthetic protein FliR [Devosia sp.]|uniref:flagellar biosynthetic protein FliR n=1 Tax=Devosia sp. XGJD_8 TaxID=3391187 RepID=UPI001DD486EA|nr:flagellar type III secretion system protein FliR [Alphaproteobacteria bacterium]MBU1559412.1 flagellar type III secretion system protein FliR [Alphaproteobacteria bacterium]MBU2301464.1 flagellar type III secretion system protein FliR [Alphaproteobacteria bacterium]MBU2369348.1 flagellar type III secretion system protein FliR [Alphaproteobacteria bacterium]
MTIGLDWLPETAFLYLLLFTRIGAILMLMPALGEDMIPMRMRLSFALAFTLVVYPLLSPNLPGMPADVMGIIGLIFHELAIGIILGAIARITVMATQVAGSIIAFQTGLSTAMAADPTQVGVQGAVFGSFLSFLGMVLIFATDLHHMALAATYDSYMVFPLDAPLMFDDAAQLAIQTVAGAFSVGVQMSAPFIVFGLVFNLGAGILARLMPAMQVFFVLMPANIVIGLVLFALLLSAMMGWYLTSFENHLAMWRG